MKKYRNWFITAAILGTLIVVALTGGKPEPVIEAKVVQVRVLEIESTINEEYAKYIGIIQPLDIHQATFGAIGTIETIHVKEGQQVKKGDLLATLNAESAQISLRNAQEGLRAAKSQRDEAAAQMRAQELDYLAKKAASDQLLAEAEADVLAKKALMEAAQVEYNRAVEEHGQESEEAGTAYAEYLAKRVEYEVALVTYEGSLESGEPIEVQMAYARYQAAKSAHEAATIQFNIAVNNLELAQGNLEQTRLVAAMAGVVVKVVSNPGDLATPLAPVVVVASTEVTAVIGLSQRAVNAIQPGMKATVIVNQREFQGRVLEVALLPDATSRTYQAKVAIEAGEGLNLGETAAVQIETGPREGIWLSLSTIMNDGEDFVYVVTAGRIARRIVTLGSIANQQVLVQGLKPGDWVVVEGGRRLRPGIEVEILEVVKDHE